MKQIVVIVSFIGLNLILISCEGEKQNPRVIIFTDINIDKGDPDDRQSLIHLLWYADELDIRGIIPDRWDAGGYEACQLAIDNYAIDFQNYQWSEKGYPLPEDIRKTVANNAVEANSIFQSALGSSEKDPLYVLVWGNLELCRSLLSKSIENTEKIRLITIGTGPMLEKDIPNLPESWPKSKPCEQLNWNGFGRDHLYENRDFNALWWIEMNWTYSGMFEGDEPAEMFAKLVDYGDMGAHIKEVVKNHPWAQYFRVGDTPSVLYLLDPEHDIDDPTESSWAGKFTRAWRLHKPNYYTDYAGDITWNYKNPCTTWENHDKVAATAQSTLLAERDEMYQQLLTKLDDLYRKQ